MSVADLKARTQQIFDLFNSHDVQAASAYFAEDIDDSQFHIPFLRSFLAVYHIIRASAHKPQTTKYRISTTTRRRMLKSFAAFVL